MNSEPEHYRRAWYYHRPNRPRQPHEVHWLEPETRIRRVRSFPDERLARAFLKRKTETLNAWLAPPAPGSPGDWLQAVMAYLEDLAPASPRYRDSVSLVLRQFSALTKVRNTADATPAVCRRYFELRRAAGFTRGKPGKAGPPKVFPVTESTLARDHRTLHAAFNWMVREGVMAANPLANVRKPRPERRQVVVPTAAEWVRLLEVLPDVDVTDRQGWHLLILLGVLTGLDSESVLLDLRFGVPDHAARRGRVQNYVVLGDAESHNCGLLYAVRRKTGVAMLHALPPAVNDRLAQRIDALPAGAARLFPRWRTWPRKDWLRITAAAHLTLPFRYLRRASALTAAVRQAEAAAQGHLAHSSPAVTRKHYLDSARIQLEAARHLVLPPLPPLPPFEP